jgi:hypothetical protein
MKGSIKALAAAAAIAMSAACSDSATTPTGTDAFLAAPAAAQAPSSTLTFASTQSNSEQSPQTASGSVGGIDFTGSLTTPTPCYNVTATHRERSSSVTVTVSAARTGDFCIQVITYNNYVGRVSGLAPGTYTFTVVHEIGSSRSTAFNGTVTVQ